MLIFSNNVNRTLVLDFLRSLSRDTSMVAPSLRTWKPENNNNLRSTIKFGKIVTIQRHNEDFKQHLT